MFDFTLNKEDKDSYIVDVRLNEDETYTVIYASGRQETNPFSIHNYQVELFRMERQFNEYNEEYVRRIWNNGPIRAYLIAMMLIADAFYINYICDVGANVVNILLLSLMVLQQIPRIIDFFNGLIKYVRAKKKVELYKEYLANKNQFSVPVEDKLGRKEDWYLIDLANIDQFEDVKGLNDYALTLTSEVKEEQGISFTKKFKGQA